MGDASAPSVIGSWQLDDDAIEFRPDFPLQRQLTYRAVFEPRVLLSSLDRRTAAMLPNEALSRDFELPRLIEEPSTRVTAVYPSADQLPENLLRFYLHFSAPMSRGDAYRYISIRDATGAEVELAILELEDELWDARGQRLTLLFDPGRIKSGLRPRREVGSALHADFDFSLVVDEAWPDARGVPLEALFEKRFSVTAPDRISPDPQRWRLARPAVGTRQPLIVDLDEPLDEGLLQHMLWIERADDSATEGVISIERSEQRWIFTPTSAWEEGAYVLNIDQRLEDRAGNSIHRLFEVDREAEGQSPSGPASITRLTFMPR